MQKRTQNRPKAIAATTDRDSRMIAIAFLFAAGGLVAAQILLLTSP